MTSTKTPARKKASQTRPTRTVRKYDWDVARALYVEGVVDGKDITYPTLEQVGERCSIPAVRVRERSAMDHWGAAREAQKITVASKIKRERILKLSNAAVQFDDSALTTAQVGMGLVQGRLAELAQARQSRQSDREQILQLLAAGHDPKSVELLFPQMDARELATLASAAATFQTIGKAAMGQDIHRASIEVTGAGGGPVEMDITARLLQDDPKRLDQFFEVAKRSGLADAFLALEATPKEQDGSVIHLITDAAELSDEYEDDEDGDS